jgi:hypothetical protein
MGDLATAAAFADTIFREGGTTAARYMQTSINDTIRTSLHRS